MKSATSGQIGLALSNVATSPDLVKTYRENLLFCFEIKHSVCKEAFKIDRKLNKLVSSKSIQFERSNGPWPGMDFLERNPTGALHFTYWRISIRQCQSHQPGQSMRH
jgi:hypothetical protein